MNLLFMDFETTGLSPTEDRITEAAFVVWDTVSRQPLQSTSFLVWCKRPIPMEVAQITGIGTPMIKYNGYPESRVIEVFETLLRRYDPKFLVAHNGKDFDFPFLHNLYMRQELRRSIDIPIIDTMLHLPFPDGVKTRKLTYLACEQGFLNPFPHRALMDVYTMVKVLDHYCNDLTLIIQNSYARTYLLKADVPFVQKDLAKEHGFKWNPEPIKEWRKSVPVSQFGAEGTNPFPFPIEILSTDEPYRFRVESNGPTD